MINGYGNIQGRSYHYGNADLDARATNHIVVDGISRHGTGLPVHDVKPMNNLLMTMIQHLTKSIPCIVRRFPCVR